MNIELIPVVFLAWFVELSQMIQSNAGILFFTSFVATLWVLGILLIMRRWDGR